MKLVHRSPFDELRDRVHKHAHREGRLESAIPELVFNRFDRPRLKRPSHAPALAVAVIVQGRKRVTVDGHTLDYDPETYLVLTEQVSYESSVIEASAEHPYLSCSLVLPPELVVKTWLRLEQDQRDDESAPAAAYVARLDAMLAETLCRLLRTLDDEAERRVIAPLVLEELVFRLLRTDSARAIRRAALKGEDQLRIQKAVTFIRENFARPLSVAKIAREMRMSPSHFAHRFREVARTSPMLYLKHVRLHEARVALLRGLRPSEVAERVGYASAAHFTRDFKSYFELPPVAYVRRWTGELPMNDAAVP